MQQVAECKVYQVNEVCECGGLFYPSAQPIMIAPNHPVFPHKCSGCGKTQNFHQKYPTMKLVPLEPLHPIEDIINTSESNSTQEETTS